MKIIIFDLLAARFSNKQLNDFYVSLSLLKIFLLIYMIEFDVIFIYVVISNIE